ncbi:hypothetical protein ABTC48_20575, partial [Acinetobacter baumannii]
MHDGPDAKKPPASECAVAAGEGGGCRLNPDVRIAYFMSSVMTRTMRWALAEVSGWPWVLST